MATSLVDLVISLGNAFNPADIVGLLSACVAAAAPVFLIWMGGKKLISVVTGVFKRGKITV